MEEDGYLWMIKDSDRRKGDIPDIIKRFRKRREKNLDEGQILENIAELKELLYHEV